MSTPIDAVRQAHLKLAEVLTTYAVPDWPRKGLQEAAASLAAALPLLEEAVADRERLAGDDYVAWLRYVRKGEITAIQVCDSDADGAFKVYRKHSADAARALDVAKRTLLRVSMKAPGYDWNSDPDCLTLAVGNACEAIDAARKREGK